MMAPVQIPSSLVAGDTWSWTDSLADYPASSGYTLKHALLKSGTRIQLTSAADGDDHQTTVTAATTAAYTAGTYSWTAYVEKGSGPTLERYTVASGTVEIKVDLAAQSAGYDARSPARKIYDTLMTAYQSAIDSRAFVAEYEIAGRRMKFNSKADWITEINYWKAEVGKEEKAAAILAGEASGSRILVRF